MKFVLFVCVCRLKALECWYIQLKSAQTTHPIALHATPYKLYFVCDVGSDFAASQANLTKLLAKYFFFEVN